MPITPYTDATGQAAPKQQDTGRSAVPDPVKEAVPAAPTEEAMSPKFAALARREKALRQIQREMQAKEKALQDREALFQAKAGQGETQDSWKTKLKQDPWQTMLDVGMSPGQVAQVLLNQPKAEDIELRNVKSELQRFREDQEAQKKQAEAAQKQQYDTAKTQLKNDVTAVIDADEAFETIKTMNAHDAVVELIEQTYHSSGVLVPIAQAAKEIEEYLMEEAIKIAGIKKLKARMEPKAPTEPAAQKPAVPTEKQPLQTLSNRVAAPTPNTGLSAQERRQRAILRAQGIDPDSMAKTA